MAYDTSKEGLRNRLVKSIFGHNLGFADANNDVLGVMLGFQTPVDGWNAAGTTIVSTAVTNNLPAGGCSVVGASGASGTTAYNLAAPIPGVQKTIFNPTTGVAQIGTSGAGAFICSSGSVTSTLGQIILAGKGGVCVLQALTTALWGVVSPAPGVASASTAVTFG